MKKQTVETKKRNTTFAVKPDSSIIKHAYNNKAKIRIFLKKSRLLGQASARLYLLIKPCL